MKHYLFLFLATFALLISCCNDDGSVVNKKHNLVPNTLKNKKVVVISDIHMGDKRGIIGGWGWFNDRRTELISFLRDLATKSDEYGTLVVAGDMFDEWVAPMDECPYKDLNGNDVRTESEYFKVLVRDNKDVLDAFREVRNAGIELVYVPGNHDLTCTKEDFDTYLPGLFTQARDAFGLGSYTPDNMDEVVIEHGHRYDYNNMPNPISTPGGYYPIGYVISKYASTLKYSAVTNNGIDDESIFNDFSNILYNPESKAEYDEYLASHGITDWMNYNEFCDALMQIKRDEKSVDSVYGSVSSNGNTNNLTDFPEDFNHFAANAAWAVVMIAKPPHSIGELLTTLFTEVKFPEPYEESYLFCDIIPYFHKPVLFQNLWTNDNWALLQKTNNVSVPLPFVVSILAGGLDPVLDAIAPTQFFDDPDSDKRIVVFGHTHKGMIVQHKNTDREKCLYANSGCWIDNKWGNPASGVTFKTYVELEKKKDTYTVTLREWGKDEPLATDNIEM